jgi:hypothetical protein
MRFNKIATRLMGLGFKRAFLLMGLGFTFLKISKAQATLPDHSQHKQKALLQTLRSLAK